jgi:glycosyltransferase involved in cell wall biosynthesis
MRIKNLIIYYPSFESGGVEKIIKNLIRFFISKGIKIFLITSNKQNLKIIKKNKNLKIILIKNNYYAYLPTRLSSSINSIKYLNHLLKKMNNSDTIVHSMQSNFIPIIISKILNFKVVIRNSEDPIESIKYSENKLFSYIIFILRFIFYNFADFIVTNSKGSAKSLETFVFNKKKISHIYNPYMTDEMIKKSKIKFKKKNIVMAAGRLTIQKNFIFLIDAFKKSSLIKKGYILNIFGKGYLEKKIKLKIKSEKLNNSVYLKGWSNDLTNEYKKSKIFVLPSLYEGLGNVLIEAINYGAISVATNCKSGPTEILMNGKGGAIVPINDTKFLAKTLDNIIIKNRFAQRKLNIAKKNLKRFNYKSQSQKYLNLLNDVLIK